MTVDEMLEAIHSFLDEAAPEKLPALERIAQNAGRANFRVCVAGGFSRGKSHFLNQLLDCRLLPESAVPTTACLTEISWGREPALQALAAGGKRDLPLDALPEFSQTPAGEPPRAELLIRLPSPLLSGGLVLVDTPGVDDIIAQSAEVTHAALENADAAIVMISAIAPFSLTEQAFIRAYMQDRAIPLLAFCISFMDQIPAEAAQRQLAFIQEKCAALYPQMALFVPDCRGAGGGDTVCGLDGIRDYLLCWAQMPEMANLRQKMVLRRLLWLLRDAGAGLAYKAGLLERELDQGRAEMAGAVETLDDQGGAEVELRVWFIGQKEALEDKIRKMSRAWSHELINRLERNDDAEEIILASFDEFYGATRDFARANLEKSLTALSRKMADLYGAPLETGAFGDFPSSIPITLARPESGNLPVNMLIDEIFRQGELALNTLAMRLPGGSLIWNSLRPFAHELLEKARQFLGGGESSRTVFEKQISTICSRMNMSFKTEIERIYGEVFAAARRNRQEWLAARRAELETSLGLAEKNALAASLAARAGRARALAGEIERMLEERG